MIIDPATIQIVQDQSLSSPMTVLSMVNGMIGGLILILPILALNAGWALTLIVIFVTGFFSLYSCHLCVMHMGDQPDLDYAILRHFNGDRGVKIFYDICVWLNLILIDFLYFELIIEQWNGLVRSETIIIPIVNFFLLLGLVFVLKYFEFGADIMAYGIISIIVYLLFLIWVIATGNPHHEPVQYKAFGTGSIAMAAAMGQAFSIQSFFIPVLKKNKKPQNYAFYTFLAYMFGGLAYYYIAYVGSFGILHRTLLDPKLQTIEGYFTAGAWQVNIIQAIYLIHLYSVFPEFMIISKKRLFGVIGIAQSPKNKVNTGEIVYFILAVAVCLVIGIFGVSINDIIDINGAVIGFCFIYFLPVLLHIKCLYFSKGKILMASIPIGQEQEQVKFTGQGQSAQILAYQRKQESDYEIQGKNTLAEPLLKNPDSEQGNRLEQSTPNGEPRYSNTTVPVKDALPNLAIQLNEIDIQNSFYYCGCDIKQYTPVQQGFDLIAMIIMVVLGAFIMVNGIMQVAK